MQLFQYFPTEVVQIDLEWPILAILQLFQYFPTEVVQIDLEWLILAFLAHLVFYQMSLCNHDLSVMHSCHPASALSSIGVSICAQPS